MKTIKPNKRGRPSKGASVLNAHVILACARSMMAEDGKPPSIRKLAGQLQIDAMAIYHYYKNKDALLEAIAVSLIEEVYRPTGQQPWQQEITLLSNSYLQLLAAYPGLLETLLTMQALSPAQVFMERFNIILAPLSLPANVNKHALDLLVDYLHGFALALTCNNGRSHSLEVTAMDGPLQLFFRAVESYHSPNM